MLESTRDNSVKLQILEMFTNGRLSRDLSISAIAEENFLSSLKGSHIPFTYAPKSFNPSVVCNEQRVKINKLSLDQKQPDKSNKN
jgi:hypothetical protein